MYLRPESHTKISGVVGQIFKVFLVVYGAIPPYSWEVDGLPDGLLVEDVGVSECLVWGIVGRAGAFSVNVVVRDGDERVVWGYYVFEFTGTSVVVVPETLSDAVVGAEYSVRFEARDGESPCDWHQAGVLPLGLEFDAHGGCVVGVPGESGEFPIAVAVGTGIEPRVWGGRTYLLKVVAVPLIISTAFLPPGCAGLPYKESLVACGGVPPYLWSCDTLPPALTLDPIAGEISGVPHDSGQYEVLVKVTDGGHPSAEEHAVFALRISSSDLQIETEELPTAWRSHSYSVELRARGGMPPYRWSLTSLLSLPPGLMLDSERGVITGIVSRFAREEYAVGIALMGANGEKVETIFPLRVRDIPLGG